MALINTLGEIGNAIREKTGGTDLIPLKEMASAIRGISTGEQENTIDNTYYMVNFNSAFVGAEFPENYELVLRIRYIENNGSSFNGTFNNCGNLKTLKLINERNADKALNITNTFARGLSKTPTLELIDLTEFNRKFSTCLNAFRYQEKLKSVLGKLNLSECTSTSNIFQNCYALEEIEFESETIKLSISFAQSSKLSATSIQSIIDGLATVETAQTLTLPKTLSAEAEAVVSANIEEIDEKIVIKGKEGWTLAR